jgi:arabinogalactan oligomer/maltooligosaccharide transport system permease protein
MMDNRDNYTVAIGIQLMQDQEFINTYYLQSLAGSVVVAVPISVLFLIMQKYYVEGVTGGAVKG